MKHTAREVKTSRAAAGREPQRDAGMPHRSPRHHPDREVKTSRAAAARERPGNAGRPLPPALTSTPTVSSGALAGSRTGSDAQTAVGRLHPGVTEVITPPLSESFLLKLES